jgi:hypothetical protein
MTRTTAQQKMYADIFFAAGNAFEITVVHPIGHIICSHIERTENPSLCRALCTHLGTYRQRRIIIRHIYSDNEKGILCMDQDFAGAGFTRRLAGPGMHIHIIERTIRYVKEGVRGLLSGFKYPCPKIIFLHMVTFEANRLNMFPSATRTDNISAFQLMFNRHVNAAIDCRLEFGAYYQVHNRLHSYAVEIPRTIGAIGVERWQRDMHIPWPLQPPHFQGQHLSTAPYAARGHHAPHRHSKIKITKDPFFQISALQSPALDDTPIPASETTLITADDKHQDLTLLDVTHVDRAPSPPPSTHRADDLPLPSHPIPAEADSRGDTPVQADDRQVEKIDDYTDEPAVPDEREAPLTAELSTNDVTATDGLEPTVESPPAQPPHVYQTRIRRPPDRLKLMCTYHMTARRAIKENPDEAIPVIKKELETLLHKHAFHGVHYENMDAAQRKGIIRSQMNVTQKYAPSSDGNGRMKDKLKARLVGG